jgi:glutamyl-tRNA reductase
MSLLLVGLSHRTAPVSVLERTAVPAAQLAKVLDELVHSPDVTEAMVLSTCNRTEVLAVVDAFHGGLAGVSDVLARHSGLDVAHLAGQLYVHYASAAVQHLFEVAAGLDSMVVGEAQILGQLRGAYAGAAEQGATGRILHDLAQHALRVGKRVHTETGIDAAGRSVMSEALQDAAAAIGGLAGRRALIIGAGSMGGLAAAQLRRAGIAEVVVANRTEDNARRLAGSVADAGTPARAIPLAEVPAALAVADLVVTCTGSTAVVLSAETVGGARPATGAPALAVCDLGLPRDTDPAIGLLPGVTLIDLAGLQRRLADSAGADVDRARGMVGAEVRDYLSAQRAAEVTPTVTALRRKAADVVDAELLRLDGRLPDLDPAHRAEVTRTVRRVVDKLLHLPTVRVKQLAAAPGGAAYADALRELFALDPGAVTAVAGPDPATPDVPAPAGDATTGPAGDRAGSPARRRGGAARPDREPGDET